MSTEDKESASPLLLNAAEKEREELDERTVYKT